MKQRGLQVSDDDRALRWLERVGYYRLTGYLFPFKIEGSDGYQSGTSLDFIIRIYKFDCQLRLLALQAIDRIEIAARASITYELARSLGTFGHTEARNFDRTFKHRQFMVQIDREEDHSRELFVKHYRQKYAEEPELPIWMATELMSMGTLSRMYQSARASDKKKIAQHFHLSEGVFGSWLHCLCVIRNTCAHHNRFWNREWGVKPELLNIWKASGIKNDRFYIIALVIQRLLHEIAPQNQWAERLKQLLRDYPEIRLASMNFPANWAAISPWA